MLVYPNTGFTTGNSYTMSFQYQNLMPDGVDCAFLLYDEGYTTTDHITLFDVSKKIQILLVSKTGTSTGNQLYN
jgi:hypothetical protein